MNKPPSVLMYGGGRQTIAIIVLILQGKLPMPDHICIADTEREKETTWAYLDNIVQPNFPQKIHRIKKSDYATVDLFGGANKDALLIPAFTNQSGQLGKLETFCSNEWKARVCDRFLKKTLGVQKFIPWIGFSIDEPKRWKKRKATKGDSEYMPLVETVPTTKQGCIDLVKAFGWPEPVHSACWMCPLQSDDDWLDNTPGDQIKAGAFEQFLQMKDQHVFLHRSLVPINSVELKRKPKDQQLQHELELCDSGMCML